MSKVGSATTFTEESTNRLNTGPFAPIPGSNDKSTSPLFFSRAMFLRGYTPTSVKLPPMTIEPSQSTSRAYTTPSTPLPGENAGSSFPVVPLSTAMAGLNVSPTNRKSPPMMMRPSGMRSTA